MLSLIRRAVDVDRPLMGGSALPPWTKEISAGRRRAGRLAGCAYAAEGVTLEEDADRRIEGKPRFRLLSKIPFKSFTSGSCVL